MCRTEFGKNIRGTKSETLGSGDTPQLKAKNRRLTGNYHLDEATNKLTVAWRYPGTMHDSVYAVLSNWRPNSGMTLTGKMGNKLLQMQLIKDKK